MILYHLATTKAGEESLENGLQLTTKRTLGDNPDIKKADDFLDASRPAKLIAAGVRRSDNIYAFIGDETILIDIRSGQKVPLTTYAKPGCMLLRLAADAAYCYVSDLDLYDSVKAAITNSQPDTSLARQYWGGIVPLAQYEPGSIRRPEVMITCAVPAERIVRVV